MKVWLLFLLFLVPCYASANSPFGRTTLSGIIVHDFGAHVVVQLPAPASNGEGCAVNDMLALQKAHPLFREIYAALLSAFHANGAIQGWVNSCDPTFKMPVLTRLDLVR